MSSRATPIRLSPIAIGLRRARPSERADEHIAKRDDLPRKRARRGMQHDDAESATHAREHRQQDAGRDERIRDEVRQEADAGARSRP